MRQKNRKLNLNQIKYRTYLIVCSYHVTYTFQSESILYGCLNFKELLARNTRDMENIIKHREH